MKRPADPAPRSLGSIHRDEVLPLRVVASRLGWGQKEIRRVQREGLAVCQCGRFKYTTGRAVLEFVGGAGVQQQAGDQGQRGNSTQSLPPRRTKPMPNEHLAGFSITTAPSYTDPA